MLKKRSLLSIFLLVGLSTIGSIGFSSRVVINKNITAIKEINASVSSVFVYPMQLDKNKGNGTGIELFSFNATEIIDETKINFFLFLDLSEYRKKFPSFNYLSMDFYLGYQNDSNYTLLSNSYFNYNQSLSYTLADVSPFAYDNQINISPDFSLINRIHSSINLDSLNINSDINKNLKGLYLKLEIPFTIPDADYSKIVSELNNGLSFSFLVDMKGRS